MAVANLEDPTTLSYLIASSIRLSVEERQELLEEVDLAARLRRLTVLCNRELELLELGAKIQSDVQLDMDKTQREFFLRQQLKAIREELGEGPDDAREVEELRERLVEVAPPEEVRAAAERELARLERLPAESAEHGVVRTYLDWILSIPWNVMTEDDLDLKRAREILDEDHYDIEKVKDRIIEQLAVARLKQDAAGPILCFVGPPGRRQDLARAVDRARPRPPLRAHLGGRRARRERDPRPPAHLRRGAAGHDRARDPRRGRDEPGADGGRDRQDGRRRPRRPVVGDARGARPGAERHLPRPLPRPAARPLAGPLPLHGQRARDDPRPAARPHGGDPPLGLHRGGEAPHRAALPAAPPDRGDRSAGRGAGGRRRGPGHDHRRVHPRGRGAPAGAPPGRGGAAGRAAGRRGRHLDRGRGRRGRARDPRPRAHPQRGQAAHERARRGDRPRRDRRGRGDPVRGGDGDAGGRQAHRDRADRRRDARVGPGGRLVRARPGRATSASTSRTTTSRPTTSTSTSPPAPCPRTAPRRA